MNPCGFRVYFRTGQNGPDKQKKGEFTMKKTFTKLMAALAVIILTLTAAPAENAQAAPRLDKANLTLYTGQTKTLKLKGASKKTAVKWSVAKKSVATVTKNGKVKAKKAGRTSVYAETKKVICVCTVTVKKPALSTKKLTLEEGETAQLSLKGAKIRKCVSDNTAVAAVDGTGRVTAGEAGTATVTVTDTKGRKYRCVAEVTADAQADDSTVQDTGNAAPAAGETGNGTAAGSTGTAGNAGTQTAVAPGHQHTWAPHYTYVADGIAYVDCSFCTDVTCPENKGFGTDNGLRKPSGTTRPVNPQTGSTGSTGNSGSGNTGSTQAPSVTVPDSSGTGNSTQTAVPDNSTENTGNSQATCPSGSSIVTPGVPGSTETPAGETYEQKVNRIMEDWIAQHITPGMSDYEKVQAALAETTGWRYESVGHDAYRALTERKGTCGDGNSIFAKYCGMMGIQAEAFTIPELVGGQDHAMTRVWIDGTVYYADATPESFFGLHMLTEEEFSLYCDHQWGLITDEEYLERCDQLEQ